MPTTSRMLQQIRHVMTAVRETSTDAAQIALLNAADLAVNELLLQDAPDFLVGHLRDGRKLLEEGLAIATRIDPAPIATVPLRDDISPEFRYEVLHAESVKLRENLAHVFSRLAESRSADDKAFLARASAWEAALYARSTTQVPAPPSRVPAITQEKLLAYLARRFPGWKDLELTSCTQLQGGFSKKTVIFDTVDSVNGRQSLVLRAEQPVRLLHADGSDVTREFPMIQLMRRCGLPVAEPLWLEDDPSQLGCRFLVSRKAQGEMIGDTMGARDGLRSDVLDSMLDTLFRLHSIRLEPDDALARQSHLAEWLHCRTVREALLHYVTVHLPAMMAGSQLEPSPAIMRALKWLERNVPDCDEPPVILHMDFALNNLLIADNRIFAILDWETSRIGDPADELRWSQITLNQYISMPELLRRYKEGTGRDISPYRIAYSKLAGRVYATINCMNALRCLDCFDDTPLIFAFMAFRYLPMLGYGFDALIAEAEATGRPGD